MRQSRRRRPLTTDEILQLAIDASDFYFSLIGLGIKNGFTIKDATDGTAVFKHGFSRVEISIRMVTDRVPDEAKDALRKAIL